MARLGHDHDGSPDGPDGGGWSERVLLEESGGRDVDAPSLPKEGQLRCPPHVAPEAQLFIFEFSMGQQKPVGI